MKAEQLRVLVVEDSRTQALALQYTLGAAGFEAVWCKTLAEALEMLHQGSPFVLVLLDLFLPDVAGLDGLDQIRKTADVPIVVLTSHNDEATAIDALQRGAQDYAIKGDTSQSVLARTLVHAIERHRTGQRLRAMAAELGAKNDELRLLNDDKSRVLGMVAHDLRSPLGRVLGFAELLLENEKGNLLEEQLEFLSIIKSSSEFMLGLVDDLLDISTIETGNLQLRLEPVDAVEFVGQAIKWNNSLAQRKGIELAVSCSEETIVAEIDRVRVEQIVGNLITNAIKFSHPGGRIDVRVGRSDAHLVVSVADEGQGIPEDEIDRLFAPFQRTSVRPTGGEKGFGLGLAIARRIVDEHGGQMWVESEVGMGSVFSFSLPLEHRTREGSARSDPQRACTERA